MKLPVQKVFDFLFGSEKQESQQTKPMNSYQFPVVDGYTNNRFTMYRTSRSHNSNGTNTFFITENNTNQVISMGTRDNCVRVWNRTGAQGFRPMKTYN